jgi:shikimate dehydrogenase
VAAVRGLSLGGLNVTIPHKQAAAALMDELDTAAGITGAVNTIRCFENRLVGYNTDAEGFAQSLAAAGFSAAGCRAAVLGAGGAARALVVALAQMGAEQVQVIALREEAEAASQVASLASKVPESSTRSVASEWNAQTLQAACESSDLLVNATPVGMYPHQDDDPPVQEDWLRERMWVYDLVYRPVETGLLAAARERGCRAVSGIEMLVRQGALSFRLWTGREPPLAAMREAVLAELQGS